MTNFVHSGRPWGRFLRNLSVAAAFTAAGCSDPFTALKPFSEEGLRGVSVGAVTIVNQSATASTESLAYLQNEIVNRAQRCAVGPQKYDMVVSVQSFRSGEFTKGVLLGDDSELKADVSFIDPATNGVVAIYHLEAGRGGTGPAGLSSQFGERLCRYIFKSAI